MSWPTPLWSIGSVGLYVHDHDMNQDAVIGEVHVIDAAKSTKHHSGSMGEKGTIAGILVTSACNGPELATLKGYTESATARAIVGDMGALGDWYIKSVQSKRRQALNVDYPVYEVRIEVLEA